MEKVEKREVIFRGKKMIRTIFNHCLGSQIVKINNIWFKVMDNIVTENYIEYDKKLYVEGYPAKIDLGKLKLIQK